MEFTLKEIEAVMSAAIENIKLEIGFSGSHSNLASRLEEQVTFFKLGVWNSHDKGVDDELLIEIPREWEKYFVEYQNEKDPEYQEYKRLKEKFERE